MTTLFKKMRFKNIFAVGNDWIEIDFNRYRSTMFMGKNGSGKAQPLNSKILTKNGWMTMGDISVGDKIMASDGSETTVTHVHPQGNKEIFEISFKDGRKVCCCEDHLWKVWGKFGQEWSWKIISVKEIMSRGQPYNQKYSNKIFVPLYTPTEQELIDLPLDPYLLGVIIGDGSTCSGGNSHPLTGNINITSFDDEIVDRIERILENMPPVQLKPMLSHSSRKGRFNIIYNNHGNSPLRIALQELELWGKRSWEKFVPDVYKQGSQQQKLELIRGLIDTDGHIGKAGSLSFTTTSEQLSLDFQELIHSIGGICLISTRQPKFKYKGEIKTGRVAYTCHIRYHTPSDLVFLSRKRERCSNYQYSETLRLEMVDIQSIGFEEAKCITIDHPDQLYVTDGYVVTHNSTMIDAICFVLYKKPFKKINLPDLVNRANNKGLLVEIEFEAGDIEYKVRRGIKPNLFEIYKNGNLVEQDAKTGDYQDYLENQILKMNYKSFTQIVVLGIANYIPFMRLKTPERREVVEDLLDYQIFSLMNSLLSEKIKKTKNAIFETVHLLNTVDGKIEVNQSHLDAMRADNENEIKEKKNALKEMKAEHESNSKKLEELMTLMDQLQESIDDEGKVEEKIEHIEDLRKQMLHESQAIKKELAFYKDHDQCPTCNQNIEEGFKKEHISALKGNCTMLQDKMDALIKKREPLQARAQEISTVLASEIVPLQSEIDGLQATVNANLRHAKALNAEIKSMLEKTEDDEHQDMSKELESERKAILSDRDKLEKQSAIYANAALLLKDTGIKARLIRAFVPKMNELINNYLVELDFFGHFEMDENFDAVIRARHRDELSYEGLSQGQKLRIDLALLFTWRAIAKMRSNASTNLLIFDEVCDSSLDDNGIEDLMKILNGMADGHNIFIISHKGDAIVDKFEQVFKFELVNSYTTMKEVA